MNGTSHKYFVAFGISVAVVAVGFAACFVHQASHLPPSASAVGIELQPSVVELIEDQLEYDLVKVNLQLKNHFDRPVSVTEVHASCNCARILAPGATIFSGPVVLAAGESLPLCVEVNTAFRTGKQKVMVRTFAAVEDEIVDSTAKIQMNVRQGWRVEPMQLTFNNLKPGEVVSRELTISDAFPDPGIEVKRVTVSNKDRLQFEVRDPAPGGGSPSSVQAADASIANPKTRRVVAVSFRVPRERVEGVRQDTISIESAETRQPAIQIPVVWRTRPPAYSISPKRLTLVSTKHGEKLRRILICTLQEDADPNLVVLKSPSYARVEIKNADARTKRIEVDCTVPLSDNEPPAEIVFGAGPTPQPVFALPVEFYRE